MRHTEPFAILARYAGGLPPADHPIVIASV
jgi:hypothetical protein